MTKQSWRVCLEHVSDGRRFEGSGAVVVVGSAPGLGGLALPLRGVAAQHLRLVPRAGGAEVHPAAGAVQRRPASSGGRAPFFAAVGSELWLSNGGRPCGLRLVEVAPLRRRAVSLGRGQAQTPAGRRSWWRPALGVLLLLGLFAATSRPSAQLPALAAQLWEPAPALDLDLDLAWTTFVDAPALRVGAEVVATDGLREAVGAELARIIRHPAWIKRLDEVRLEWARVLVALREADLPDALAAVPLVESCYRADPVSPCCAKGWWQFMPEEGARLREDGLLGAAGEVRGCTRRSGGAPFTPSRKAPPPMACARAPYVLDGACDLARCEVDFREDLGLSTEAAVRRFREVHADATLRASGALVPVMIASHHAGYDDARLLGPSAPPKPYNLRPAVSRWVAAGGGGDFVEAAFGCLADPERPGCERYLIAQTQRYVARVLALQLLAVCRYGQSAGHDPVFAPYARFTTPDRCFGLELPSPAAIARARSGAVCPP